MKRTLSTFALFLLVVTFAACGKKAVTPPPTPPARPTPAPLVFDRFLPQFNGELEKAGKKQFTRAEVEAKLAGATVEAKWTPMNGYDVFSAVLPGPLGKVSAKCRVAAYSKPGTTDVEFYRFTFFEFSNPDFSSEDIVQAVVKHYGDASTSNPEEGGAVWEFPGGRLILLGDNEDPSDDEDAFTVELRPGPPPTGTVNPTEPVVPDHD